MRISLVWRVAVEPDAPGALLGNGLVAGNVEILLEPELIARGALGVPAPLTLELATSAPAGSSLSWRRDVWVSRAGQGGIVSELRVALRARGAIVPLPHAVRLGLIEIRGV